MKANFVRSLSIMAAATALTFALAGCATQKSEPVQASTAAPATAASYPLTKCVVSGEDLGQEPYVFTHNGKTVKLCCKDCLAKFNAEPETYMAKLTPAK